MNLIEKLRQPLNFVNDNPPTTSNRVEAARK